MLQLVSNVLEDHHHGPRHSVPGNNDASRRAGEVESAKTGGFAGLVNERIWTVDELSERLRVSTKTISRWRFNLDNLRPQVAE